MDSLAELKSLAELAFHEERGIAWPAQSRITETEFPALVAWAERALPFLKHLALRGENNSCAKLVAEIDPTGK